MKYVELTCGICKSDVVIKNVTRLGKKGVDIIFECTRCGHKTNKIIIEKELKQAQIIKIS